MKRCAKSPCEYHGMRDPRIALLCRHYAKRHNGLWFRSAARMLIREIRADRERGAA